MAALSYARARCSGYGMASARPPYAHAVPETLYAQCGGLSLAYQVFGDGPIELVVAGSFASHVELCWTVPEFEAFMERLGAFCRVLLFDKAGVGLSDPVPKVRTLDDRAAEIEAVMDTVGFETAVLFGASEGGPAALVFAAARPERTRALILTGAFSYWGLHGWDDLDHDPAEIRTRLVPELGEDYTPSVQQLARWQDWGLAVRSAWGSGAALKYLLPSVRSMRQLAMVERMSASPGMARAALDAVFRVDVRSILPTITAPALLIHARDEVVPVQCGRYIADHIPGRTRALILTGATAYWGFAGWHDMDPAEVRARLLAELDEDYTPSTEQLARIQEYGRAILSGWGSGAAAQVAMPSSARPIRQLAMFERMCASPGMARASLEGAFLIDVRPILPTITAPTLVIHAREDPSVPVQCGRYLADHIPGARLLEVEGADHFPWLVDPDRILTGIEEFLTGSHAAPLCHVAPCAPCCSPTSSPRRNTPRRPAMSGGVRCCTALMRSPRSSRNDSAARWSRAPATAT